MSRRFDYRWEPINQRVCKSLPPDLDADEIRCLIQIKAVGLPETITPDAFTNEAVLGEVVQTSAAGNAG